MSTPPRVGAMVHYFGGKLDAPECRAAIVTRRKDHAVVDLAVIGPFVDERKFTVEYSTTHHYGTWHYLCPNLGDAE